MSNVIFNVIIYTFQRSIGILYSEKTNTVVGLEPLSDANRLKLSTSY